MIHYFISNYAVSLFRKRRLGTAFRKLNNEIAENKMMSMEHVFVLILSTNYIISKKLENLPNLLSSRHERKTYLLLKTSCSF